MKDKLNETAKLQHNFITQVQVIEEIVDELASQSGEQEQSLNNDIKATQVKNEHLTDLYDAPENTTDRPTNDDVLLFQLTQTQQRLDAMTDERNALREKNLAVAKRSVILSREKAHIEKENNILQKQRHTLQSRLDALEDQASDTENPRNAGEVEVRSLRRQRRGKKRLDGLAGAKIFPALETDVDASEEAPLEAELLNDTDEIEGQEPGTLLSPKERHDIDTLFEEGSDEALSERSARFSPLQISSQSTNGDEITHELQAPVPQQSSYSGFTDAGMVYGDENSEDLIDWTPDDDFEFSSYSPLYVQANYYRVVPAIGINPATPLPASYSPTVPDHQNIEENVGFTQTQTEVTNQHHDGALNQPWDDLARALSPLSSPTHLPVQDLKMQVYLLKSEVDNFQTALNETAQQRDSALTALEQMRGELEQSRRNLATRTGERNGARQRVAILEDEIKEMEMREVQLREELRLEREEDPLADKLFVELAELRKQYEDIEEEKAKAQEKIEWLEKKVCESQVTRYEDLEKLQALEEAAEKGNAVVVDLEQRIQASNEQLDTMTSTLYARDTEIEVLNKQLGHLQNKRADIERLASDLASDLGAARQELEANKAELSKSDEVHPKRAAQEADIQRLMAELQTWKQELETTRSQAQGWQSALRTTKAELEAAENEIKKLSAVLKGMIDERDRANNEARNAVAAAEKARDEAVESRRALGAANDMGHHLRRISAENIRELVHIKEERDSALHSVSRVTRDLTFAKDEIRKLKAEIEEFEKERQVLERRFIEAERRAGEYGRQVLKLEENLESLRQLVKNLSHRVFADEDSGVDTKIGEASHEHQGRNTKLEELLDGILAPRQEISPSSPVSPVPPCLVGEEPDSPVVVVDRGIVPPKAPTTPKRKQPLRLMSGRDVRSTRNPSPVYVDPPLSPTTPKQLPKGRRDRKRMAPWDDDYEERPKKK